MDHFSGNHFSRNLLTKLKHSRWMSSAGIIVITLTALVVFSRSCDGPIDSAFHFPKPEFPAEGIAFKLVQLLGVNLVAAAPSNHMLEWVTESSQEQAVHEAFSKILPQCNILDDAGQRRVMLDVGANTGMYGTVSALMGCQAILFEPQPLCVSFIRAAAVLNHLSPSQVEIRCQGVSNRRMTIGVSPSTCLGVNQIVPSSRIGAVDAVVTVPADSIDNYLKSSTASVLLMKVDTEGHEMFVVEGAMDSIGAGKIQNLIVELTPGFWKSAGLSREQVADVFRAAYIAGNYKAVVLKGAAHSFNGVGFKRTAQEFYDYVLGADFVQADVWLYRTDG